MFHVPRLQVSEVDSLARPRPWEMVDISESMEMELFQAH